MKKLESLTRAVLISSTAALVASLAGPAFASGIDNFKAIQVVDAQGKVVGRLMGDYGALTSAAGEQVLLPIQSDTNDLGIGWGGYENGVPIMFKSGDCSGRASFASDTVASILGTMPTAVMTLSSGQVNLYVGHNLKVVHHDGPWGSYLIYGVCRPGSPGGGYDDLDVRVFDAAINLSERVALPMHLK